MIKKMLCAFIACASMTTSALTYPGFMGVYTTERHPNPDCNIVKVSGEIVHAVFEEYDPLGNRSEKLVKSGYNAVVGAKIYADKSYINIYGTPVKIECPK